MKLIIVGAGGMGREVFSWLSQVIDSKPGYQIIGFIDDNQKALDNYSYPVKIIGDIENYKPNQDEALVLAIMDPLVKKKIAHSLLLKKAKFYTLIHPSVVLGYKVKIGQGSIIFPYCVITNDILIEDFVFVNTNSTIGHDVIIGEFTSINGKVEITGNVVVGEGCMFGVGSKVIPGKKIGCYAKIGAGSTIIDDVPDYTAVFGSPPKKIKPLIITPKIDEANV
jgi:sugar O-acyltransferase (sialic acid O-acetyltransferase NeuD family)